MDRDRRGLGRYLTYANVVATLTAFAVVFGGVAVAANQLAKNSVGSKQLKKNSVTTAKIKKNAVTKAKIKPGAIDAKKVKAGSLGAGEFQLAGAPYTQIAEELRTSVNVVVPTGPMKPELIPVPGLTYTQPAGRTDTYVGAVDATLEPGCTGKRAAVAYLLMDVPPGSEPTSTILLHVVGLGIVEDNSGSRVTKRINLAPFAYVGTRYAPSAAQAHTFTLLLAGLCEGGASSVSAGPVAVDVIGTPSP